MDAVWSVIQELSWLLWFLISGTLLYAVVVLMTWILLVMKAEEQSTDIFFLRTKLLEAARMVAIPIVFLLKILFDRRDRDDD